MKKIDFVTDDSFSDEAYNTLIDKAIEIKKRQPKYYNSLNHKTLVMLFQKTSTRTRLSFEAGMTQLGGHAIFLDWKNTNFTIGSFKDEVKSVSRYADIMMARVYKHEDIIKIAELSEKPVINALCDRYHPCQVFCDMVTIKEKLGKLKGKTIAFIGDGNNVCNSLVLATRKTGMKIRIATPKGYEPEERGRHAIITHDPKKALIGADIIYTDTWISMGQENEADKRMRRFKPYQVNKELVGDSKALVMHCLPAHRGYEITDDVIDSKYSIVYDQAENRMHGQKAIMLYLMGKI